MNKIALIPAYEPDDKLIKLLFELKQKDFEIIVVNDGSGIRFKDIFNNASHYGKVLNYDKNKGKGYALKKGIEYIKNHYKEYICITMDSDGQHTVKDALKLYEYNKDNLNVLVIGKRLRNESVPVRSKFGNEITRFVFRLISKTDIYDTQSGLRSFSYKLEDYMLNSQGDRYEYEMNVLLNLKKNRIDVKEIEIDTIYFDNNSKSHFKTISDSYLIYKQIIKFSFSSFISFMIDYVIYVTFISLTGNLIFSNIFARIISSICNYNLNRKYVFKKNSKIKDMLYYFSLVILILALNTFLLKILVESLSINKYISKIIAELILFLLSYIIQRNFIFKKEDDKN